jgi:type VI secretion system protein ImpA
MIRNSFIENSGFEYAPIFDDLTEELNRYNKLLETGQPSLAGDADAEETDTDEEGTEDTIDSSSSSVPKKAAIPTSLSDGTNIMVSDQSAAIRALAAAEAYFAMHEPSAPALILVHQARVLVGKPLVEALLALLPEKAASAMIKLDSDSKFEISMARMQELSQTATTNAGGDNAFVGPKQEEEGFNAQTRIDATALILAVEGYYRSRESSSPIPLLLSKARDYLSRDFNAIIKDLIPQAEIKE